MVQKYSLSQRVKYIRTNSNPGEDCQLAIKANSQLCDALYRLSFTADKLHGAEIDNLTYQLQSHADEITVLLRRIVDVKHTGFRLSIFQDVKTAKS